MSVESLPHGEVLYNDDTTARILALMTPKELEQARRPSGERHLTGAGLTHDTSLQRSFRYRLPRRDNDERRPRENTSFIFI